MSPTHDFFVTCAKGVEDLLVRECEQASISNYKQVVGGVEFSTELINAYRLCMWSRVGSRVLLKLHQADVEDYDQLYHQVQCIDWSQHMLATNTLAIDCFSAHETLNNSHFASLKVKDAIVDQLREKFDERPSIEKQQSDTRVNAYIDRTSVIVYLDLSGEPLHRRGYRHTSGSAPLRETLAASMLYRCKWPAMAEQGASFVDIMAGSGTLLIEAAMMAYDHAPQLNRDYFGFNAWLQHDRQAWHDVQQEALTRLREADPELAIIGYEQSDKTLAIARTNLQLAGCEDKIKLYNADSLKKLSHLPTRHGLMLTNPPYGKRLGDVDQLEEVYSRIGQRLKQQFAGWNAAIITSENELAQRVGLRAHHKNTLYNGAIRCTLYQYHIRESQPDPAEADKLHPNVEMLCNRLNKNLKHLRKWANRNAVSCYRVYDADLPQYAVAIDLYDGAIVIQEYQAPKSISAGKAHQHINDVIDAVKLVFDCKKSDIIIKTRKKQSGASQYEARSNDRQSRVVIENGLKFSINLLDYLDTGLFNDHRNTRQLVRKLSQGKTMLNLFAYTGSFTVYAAAGGATATTTVDMSNTYLRWAENNMALNNLQSDEHEFIRADCLEWLRKTDESYDIIVLDPPTFSNSKKMEATLDIERDHVQLIEQTMSRLNEQGVLLFSTNAKRFKLDVDHLQAYQVRDISSLTVTEDFKRKPAHKCWAISHPGTKIDFRL